jgi:hypothetical protein
MGTRSLTYFFEDGKPFVCFYRQMDGYPSGHGVELGEILAKLKLVNGYQFGMKAGEFANGPGCLAAQVVAALKNDIGGIYLVSPELGKDSWQEYEYHIHIDSNQNASRVRADDAFETFIECRNPKEVIFSGSFEDFLKWAHEPPTDDAGNYVVVKPKKAKAKKPQYKKLRDALQHEQVHVQFRKADGSIRDMECTTDMARIPEDFHPSLSTIDSRRDKDLYKVFDLEINEWRSFREERVLAWEVL